MSFCNVLGFGIEFRSAWGGADRPAWVVSFLPDDGSAR